MADIAIYPVTMAERDETYRIGISEDESMAIEMDESIQIIQGEKYEGVYSITPTEETQILRTSDLFMKDDITINPIPSNYGLITWNGSTLTVS